jgi:hypothetical protein
VQKKIRKNNQKRGRGFFPRPRFVLSANGFVNSISYFNEKEVFSMKKVDVFYQFLQKAYECYLRGELDRSFLYLEVAANHLKKLAEKDTTKSQNGGDFHV